MGDRDRVDVQAGGTAGPSEELLEDEGSGSSALSGLRTKIKQARERRYTDEPVPGLPQIVVRYGPIAQGKFEEIYKRRKKVKLGEGRGVMAACDTLIESCLGIYERDEDGELVTDGDLLASPDGRPVTFASLGLADTGRARDEVLALYPDELAIMETFQRVLKFFGVIAPDSDEEALGE